MLRIVKVPSLSLIIASLAVPPPHWAASLNALLRPQVSTLLESLTSSSLLPPHSSLQFPHPPTARHPSALTDTNCPTRWFLSPGGYIMVTASRDCAAQFSRILYYSWDVSKYFYRHSHLLLLFICTVS